MPEEKSYNLPFLFILYDFLPKPKPKSGIPRQITAIFPPDYADYQQITSNLSRFIATNAAILDTCQFELKMPQKAVNNLSRTFASTDGKEIMKI